MTHTYKEANFQMQIIYDSIVETIQKLMLVFFALWLSTRKFSEYPLQDSA